MKTSPTRDELELADGEQVCATYDLEGNPIYFSVDGGSTDFEVSILAFQAKHGREPTVEELNLLAMIERNNR
jgi:hypothetical protein